MPRGPEAVPRSLGTAPHDPGSRAATPEPAPGLRRLDAWLWCLPIAAVCLASAPTLLGGYPRGHDWSLELVRTAQYEQALRVGQWPPAWASELYGGYGSPIFLFYAPLFLSASALASALLGSVQAGSALVLALLPALAALAVVAMVRQLPGAPSSSVRVAASFYVLHPYLLGDAWLRNANAEYAALCLSPIALAGLLRAPREPWPGAVWLSAGLALVLLAHNLSAMWLAAGCAAATAVHVGGGRTGRRAAFAGSAGIALALALTSFFWPAALLWSSEVRSEDLLTGKFDFHANFPAPAELFGWREFFSTGPLTAAVLVALAVAVVRGRLRPAERGPAAAVCGAALVLALLATPYSVRLWESLPLLRFYQFPWRLAGPLALLAALALALLVSAASARRGLVAALPLELLLSALVAVQAVPRLRAYTPLPASERDRIERSLAPEELLRSPQPATVGDDYLPRRAVRTEWQSEPRRGGPWIDARGAQVELLEDHGVDARLRVSAVAGTTIRWARWDFPHWRLTVDGRSLPLERTLQGTLASRVPAGDHELALRYEPPLSRRLGTGISALAVVAWLGLATYARRAPAAVAAPAPPGHPT